MLAEVPSQESVFHAQYKHMAQTFVQYQAYYAKQAMQSLSPDEQSKKYLNADLTTITRTGTEYYLTNPYFSIEGCLDSL